MIGTSGPTFKFDLEDHAYCKIMDIVIGLNGEDEEEEMVTLKGTFYSFYDF